jgi:recombinational DNA repair protein RecT
MKRLSTREAARNLGISYATLSNHVAAGKVAAPEIVMVGGKIVHMWTEEEVEAVRKRLPKIANGRKTRWQRQREAQKKKGTITKKKGPRPKK